MKTTTAATIESLNLSAEEIKTVEVLRDAGFLEDQIYCLICEERETRETVRLAEDWGFDFYVSDEDLAAEEAWDTRTSKEDQDWFINNRY